MLQPAPWWLYPLVRLVRENYAARRRGELPDEWYWADRLLLELGYYVPLD